MAKRLSIRDIAAELNISKTTISFILNGKAKEKRISDELADRVIKYAAQRAYKPNELAKSLSTGKTMIIGLMVENISDYFFAQVAYHIEELAYKNGYRIIYCSTDNDLYKTKGLIRLFRERHVDGYIITPPSGIEKDIQELIDDGLPVVLFDRYLKGVDTSYVVLDNYKGSYEASKYLIGAGFKNIAFVVLDSDQVQMQDRREGYQQAMAESELPLLIKAMAFNRDFDHKVKEMVKFIKMNPQIDAIFFATNYLAFSGIKAMSQLNINIPEDIAMVVFDDHEVFNIYSPSITAVAQPIKKLAMQSIHALLKMLDPKGDSNKPEQVVVPAELLVRDSTKRNGVF
ncbi:LacI family transcriptional regulator [Pedobacter sp. AK017]|uniref:LacI family DNA-binding transcriptional regulator n=1 Tax=Pedobacter sp. AK017 TaxID=2723073 RepID=UPI0016211D90|nr:substrate-binding domain-containing protein [Pedobacter sp. AK017]MBB5440263.1 LacI family transcriptional regulator [Pedobacter sp. AK017]